MDHYHTYQSPHMMSTHPITTTGPITNTNSVVWFQLDCQTKRKKRDAVRRRRQIATVDKFPLVFVVFLCVSYDS